MLRVEEVAQDGRGDVIGKIGHYLVGPAGAQFLGLDVEHISVDERNVGLIAKALAQSRQQFAIELDRDQPAARGVEPAGQFLGQDAEARSYLNDAVIRLQTGSLRYTGRHAHIPKEMLAQPLLGLN